MRTYPLLQSQVGIFLEWSQHPEKMVYNIPILLSFPFFVSAEQLKQALVNVLSCHPSLFVRLFEENNRIIQRIVINDSPQIEIKEISDSLLDEEKQTFVHPFKLFDEQLWRAKILKGEKNVFLLLDIHHFICDGISINIFLEDLCKVLEEQIIQKESCTLCDYAEEQERSFHQQDATGILFHDSPFNGDELCCNFPTSTVESTTIVDERKEQNVYFSNKDILNDCQSVGIHPSSLIMSAVSYVFGRLSYSKNVCLAAIHSGRLDYRIKGSVGMFVNTFPIVARNEDTTVCEYISSIKNSYRIGKNHPNYSFADAVSSLKVKPDILFVYQIGVVDKFRVHEVNGSPVEFELFLQDEIDFKIIIWIDEKEDAPYIKVKYNSKEFDDAFILQFAKLISDVSDYFVRNPYSDLLSVPLVTEGDRRRLIQLGEGEHLDYNQNETLVDLFRSQAQRSPENIAVVSKGEEFTYSQIDRYSNFLANILHHQYRVSPEDVVGVMIDRSELMVIYPMSIMKTGGVYMPLDYEHLPSDRLQSMCSDANVKLILTDSAGRVAEHLPGYKGKILCVSTSEMAESSNDDLSFVPSFGPSNRFVILYTSGSTGDPKGCQLEHRGIVNFCHWYVKEFEMTESDKTIAYANFGFDAHMMDIYPALSVGACVHILPNDLRMNLGKMNEYMEKEGISIAFLTTQVGLLFVNEFENRSLRLLSVSGEKLPPLKRPAYKLYNAGAPTECTIYAFFYHIEEEQYIRPIIGKALANCQLYVVDQDLNIQPQGVAGELLIGGRGVCRGYLNKPEETAKRFITHNGERVYRTGDMVRWNEDGLLEYIGRIDKQVKINGYRIELSEIEAQVAQFKGIKQVCVEVRRLGKGEKLVCFYSLEYSVGVNLDDIDSVIKLFLKDRLPSYMIPSIYVQLDEFPSNRNGKVDRSRLALPQNTSTINIDNNTESIIYEIYSKVLGYTNFRKDDNFFEIGGDSKSAIELLVYMEKAGYAISYEDIYKFPTVCEMANFIQGETSHQAIKISPNDEITTYLHNTLGCGADFIGLSKRIILTGATGFLGIHILNQLLENTDSVVYCPIRKSGEKIDIKLNRLYEFYFSKQIPDYYNDRLFIFEGDLSAAAVYCQLELVLSDSSKTTIINCAANVKHFGLGNTIQQNNVDIIKNIVKLCKKYPSVDLIHMSTLSVAGFQFANNNSSFSESDLYNGQLIENEYVQSKFESEAILLRAMIHDGVQAKILRLGNISPRTYDGGFQFNIGDNAFMNRILSIVKLRRCSIGIANTFVDMSPVDEIAKAVILLSKLKTERPVFHLYNDNLVPISLFLDVMNAQGYEIEKSSDKDFYRYLSAHNEKDSMFSMFAYKAKADHSSPCISSFYTNYILHKYNFTWSINGKDYIECLFKRLIGEKG